ncbi:amidohydrolase [Alkalihalobacillus sp. CinArs1]|uniref:amidohydrolase n=1 Tax=Alkalihalobacillus sp. CinArs1 TaxID=2995314 RepID=UPI0022DE6B1C|nr:amidohydrolase [Alkalihalobacillus sp. CinArs1]
MKVINNVELYQPGNETIKGHLLIEDGKIARIEEGLYKGDEKDVIEGEGKTVAPSFNDTHMHLLRYGLMKKELDLREVTSWNEMKEIVRDRYTEEKMEENDWIIGRGLIDSQFSDIDHLLTAKDLEELEYKKPMFFLHEDGHECIVNEEALKIIRDNDELEENHNRFIEKDENGEWTGRFKDSAVHFIKFHFKQKSEEEVYEAIHDAVPHLLKHGISSVHTDDLNYTGAFERVWDSYRRLEDEEKLPVQVHLHHYVYNLNDMKKYLNNHNRRTGDGTDRVRMGAFKIFLDGTQRLHTAALRKPYHDKPETSGALIYSQEELNEMVQTADDHEMQVTMHAIGDRTVEQALKAIEKVGTSKMRHRIIHAQILAPDLLERLKKVKPYLETQPGFMMGEYDQTADWVGKEQEKYCNPWKTVSEMGIPFTGSSDCPIGELNPFVHIYAAVMRQDEDGNPKGGWIPKERLSVSEIYKAYTATGAELEFQEEWKGKLEKEFTADFVLLSDHPEGISPHKLKEVNVLQTWIKGERVY